MVSWFTLSHQSRKLVNHKSSLTLHSQSSSDLSNLTPPGLYLPFSRCPAPALPSTVASFGPLWQFSLRSPSFTLSLFCYRDILKILVWSCFSLCLEIFSGTLSIESNNLDPSTLPSFMPAYVWACPIPRAHWSICVSDTLTPLRSPWLCTLSHKSRKRFCHFST